MVESLFQIPDNKIEIKGNWVRKESSKRVYLVAPNKYYYTDLSLPTSPTKLAELYNKVENKAIVTGRIKDMRERIETVLDDFGLEQPNHGLYCFPSRDDSDDKAACLERQNYYKVN
jgi:hypothetical protein